MFYYFLLTYGEILFKTDGFLKLIKYLLLRGFLQFLGHAIEGNRPSLMTSLTQTAFQAPLFTLNIVCLLYLKIKIYFHLSF